MAVGKFNLLDECWIKVETLNGENKEISLIDLLANAQDYLCLAGETKHQDFSILRLIEAILISTIYEDEENYLENQEDAYRVWSDIYQSGHFPIEKIRFYLEKHKDNFYLIHPEKPFAQVVNPIVENGKSKKPSTVKKIPKTLIGDAKKLDGCYLQSDHKSRYYRHDEPQELSYGEAARWLLTMLNFDDCAVKAGKKTPGKPDQSKMTGWLGCFSPVYLTGDNLFKTIMLNLVLCDRDYELWCEPRPIWEREQDDSLSHWQSIPKNLPELYTTYSRRMWLEDNGTGISRFTSYPGEIFEYTESKKRRSYINQKVEPSMALVRQEVSDKGKDKCIFESPQKMLSGKELWTYYPSICAEKPKMPLIILWVSRLNQKMLIKSDEIVSLINLRTDYGSMQGSIIELSSEELVFRIETIKKENASIIADQVGKLNKLISYAGNVTDQINLLKGFRDQSHNGSELITKMITEPFKDWIFQFSSENESSTENLVKKWEDTIKKISNEFLTDLEKETDPDLLRLKKVEKKGKKEKLNSAIILNRFSRHVDNLYSKENVESVSSDKESERRKHA